MEETACELPLRENQSGDVGRVILLHWAGTCCNQGTQNRPKVTGRREHRQPGLHWKSQNQTSLFHILRVRGTRQPLGLTMRTDLSGM